MPAFLRQQSMPRICRSVITVLGSSTKLYSANYYDFEGRITKTFRQFAGGYDTTSTVYTFTGKPKDWPHSASGRCTHGSIYLCRDHADRISKEVQHSLGSTSNRLYDATYDNWNGHDQQYPGTSTNKHFCITQPPHPMADWNQWYTLHLNCTTTRVWVLRSTTAASAA